MQFELIQSIRFLFEIYYEDMLYTMHLLFDMVFLWKTYTWPVGERVNTTTDIL